MRHLLLLLGLAAALTVDSRASAEKPLVAVVPFTGPQARRAEEVVVRTLRKKGRLVPASMWAASARKLFAHTHSPEDIAAVAADLGAKVVVTGVVKREGRGWQLLVSVRDGASGRSRDKLKYALKGPRISPSTLSELEREVSQAFVYALSSPDTAESTPAKSEAPTNPAATPPANAATPPAPAPTPPAAAAPPPPTAEAPPPPARSKSRKGRGRAAKAEEEPQPPAAPVLPPDESPPAPPGPPPPGGEPPPPSRPAPVVVAKRSASGSRPRWAPYLDVSLGATLSGRGFDFNPSSLPHYTSGVVGGLRFDLTAYPLASQWRVAGGVLSGIGLGVTVDKPFWPSSQSKTDPSLHFATSELRVEGGLRWRFTLYKPLPRPELVFLLGGGMHSFAIAKLVDPTGMTPPRDAGTPDVSYSFVSVGANVRMHFAEWARLYFLVAYQGVLDSGSVQTASEYGPASAYAVRVQGGLDFFVWHGLKLGAVGYYERVALSFSGIGALPPASSAVDQYFGGLFSIGYEL